MSVVQKFIIISKSLQEDLLKHEIFTKYFDDKPEVVSVVDDADQVDFGADIKSTLFIVKRFEDEDFSKLMKNGCSIMGDVALLQHIRNLKSTEESIVLIPSERPLHNLAMQNILITFSGIIDKNEAQQLLTLTRFMGAKSREDVTNKTTHLVAGHARGSKYRRALEFGVPILNVSWVQESFVKSQEDMDFDACSPEFVQKHKLKPFQGLTMAFVGFSEDDAKELSELTIANEGTVVEAPDPSTTHVVVDAISGFVDNDMLSSIDQTSIAHVVYKEWFWASLEIEGKANEETYSVSGLKNQARRFSRTHRLSMNPLSPALDYSRSPSSMPVMTARHRAASELLQTEQNYVKVLETIVNLFKVPLENPNTVDPILPMTDVKIIFGNVTPIYEVHKKMLSNLTSLIENDWKESNCIGKVFVVHSLELLRAYPPFVNFYEDTKKTLQMCDLKYPRFHAFLMRCQSKIECNRESLTEMLIRPVQRLPSISLILSELIKRTDESNPDKKYLMEALESIKRVMNWINEDKRKTEGQIAMFDIVNNIEDCPPNLLSALRRFVCRVEARLLFMSNDNGIIPSKSHKVVLFLFSDLIEICKVRSFRRSNSLKGNKTTGPIRGGTSRSQSTKLSSNKKGLRHLDELYLFDIMNVYKECQSTEMTDAFVVQARPSQKYEQNFRYYPFLIDDTSISKATFIQKLEECLVTSDHPDQVSDYVPNNQRIISNDEIDFGFANSLVHRMEKSRLSRVLSIKQSLLSPSMKLHRMPAIQQ